MSKLNLTARPFNLKLKYPFGISRGTITYAKNVLVKLVFDDIVAYGEAAPSSYYGEDQNSVIELLQTFKKHKSLDGYLTNIPKLKEDLSNFFPFSPSLRAAVEMAFWDLLGKINNKCLYQFFFHDDPFLKNDSNYKNIPPTSYTIGLDNLFVIETKIKEALNAGYKILKIKLGLGFEEDLCILNSVKKIASRGGGTPPLLRVDANGAWDLNTAKKMLEILPEYNVEILEQPLPKGQAHLLSELAKNSPLPIFVDEDCMVTNDIESLAGTVHGINIKLMKSGSILETFNMINLARSYNLKIMLGCMIESSCAISAIAQFSPIADYVDLDGHLLLEHDPFCGLLLENNKVVPSFDLGLGVSYID